MYNEHLMSHVQWTLYCLISRREMKKRGKKRKKCSKIIMYLEEMPKNSEECKNNIMPKIHKNVKNARKNEEKCKTNNFLKLSQTLFMFCEQKSSRLITLTLDCHNFLSDILRPFHKFSNTERMLTMPPNCH